LAVRGRLPVCVVRIRSLLHFMLLQSLPALSASGPCLCQTGGLARTIGARVIAFSSRLWAGGKYL
jgi:hypothetical protein